MHKEGQCADAMVHLSMVMDARPDDLEPVYNRAICKMAVDDWGTAFADLKRYCEKHVEPFCAEIEKAEQMHSRATGERRVPTEEEKAAYQKRKEAGELSPRRAKMQKAIHGE